jgi:hypothetical protein
MGCLDLVGLEGKAEFRGMAPSRTLTLRQNADSALYSWLLTDK